MLLCPPLTPYFRTLLWLVTLFFTLCPSDILWLIFDSELDDPESEELEEEEEEEPVKESSTDCRQYLFPISYLSSSFSLKALSYNSLSYITALPTFYLSF